MIRLISLDQTFGFEQKTKNKFSDDSPVHVIDYGDGIFCIKVDDDLNQNLLSENIILGLEKCFTFVRDQEDAKAVLLMGGDRWFLSSKTTEKKKVLPSKSLLLPLDCHVPVIAVMKGQSTGLGWLIGAMCDFLICSEESPVKAKLKCPPHQQS